jgi:hypothetical protein
MSRSDHVADVTTERLGALAAGLPRGLLLVRDELSGWLGGFDRYGGGGSDRAFALEMYGGRSYVVDRMKSPEPMRIRHLSVGVCAQNLPDAVGQALSVLKAAEAGWFGLGSSRSAPTSSRRRSPASVAMAVVVVAPAIMMAAIPAEMPPVMSMAVAMAISVSRLDWGCRQRQRQSGGAEDSNN